jgi:hypothetical protein
MNFSPARTASSSARAGHSPEAVPALSKECEEAVAKMRTVFDKRRKLMVELMRGVGFGIPVMPQGAFYVFADASKWTDDSYAFAFELLEKAGVGAPARRVGRRAWTSGKRASERCGSATRAPRRIFERRRGGWGSTWGRGGNYLPANRKKTRPFDRSSSETAMVRGASPAIVTSTSALASTAKVPSSFLKTLTNAGERTVSPG